MIKISLHGASVTQQSGVAAYSDHLKEKLQDIAVLNKHGFGGCHLNDAGFLTISDIISEAPDLCILDWNTTALSEFDIHKVSYITDSLIKANIKPVYVIFAREDNVNYDRVSEVQIKTFCEEHLIELWDLRSIVNIEFHLRDVVHTNENGAKLYSEVLYEKILFLAKENKIIITNEKLSMKSSYMIYTFPFEFDLKENSNIRINGIANGENPEIFAELVKGPFSPIVSLNNQSKLVIWDPWCHYERNSFMSLYKFRSDDKFLSLDICILTDSIDYSKCARPNFEYLGIKELKLKRFFCANFEISGTLFDDSLK